MATLNARAERYRKVQVRGASAWAADAEFSVPLYELQPLITLPNGTTYLRNLDLFLDMVVTESSGAAQDVVEARIHDVIQTMVLRIPGQKPTIDLRGNAGSRLYRILHAVEGQRPHGTNGGGTITCAKSTTTTLRVKIRIPFEFKGAKNPEDFNFPLQLLKDAELVCTWAPAATFAATLAITSGAVRARADLVERSEFRTPVRYTVQNKELAGVETQIPIAGEVLVAMIEDSIATGLTAGAVTDAERDLIHFSGDGAVLVDDVDAIDMVMQWNRIHPRARVEELADHEGDASPWVPLVFPSQHPWSLTYLPLFASQPILRVTGTDASPHVVILTTQVRGRAGVVADLADAGVSVPAGMTAENAEAYLSSKGLKGNVRGGKSGAERLPVRLHAQAASELPQ